MSGSEVKKLCWLNFDTLIIQYNAAVRKVQRLQDLVTDGHTHGGIWDSTECAAKLLLEKKLES